MVACAQHPLLVVPDGGRALRWQGAGVEVLAASHMWSGAPSDFESYLTPIALDIHNESGDEIVFRFEDVVLSDGAGHDSNPLVVNLPIAFTSKQPGSRPAEERFVPGALHDSSDRLLGIGAASQPTAALEQDSYRITPSEPLFSWDWSAFREWRRGLRGIELPREYLQRALLPISIAAGKEAHGFLYFPRVPDKAQTMTLTWLAPRKGNPILARFKFNVKD
jgi:hypothetical protein